MSSATGKVKYHLVDGRLAPVSYTWEATYDAPIVPISESEVVANRLYIGQVISIVEITSLSDLNKAIAEYHRKYTPSTPLRLYCSFSTYQKIRALVQPHFVSVSANEGDTINIFGLSVYTSGLVPGHMVVVI